MSWLNCEKCDLPINSDDDPDCFLETGNYRRLHREEVLCEQCRDKTEAEQEQNDAQQAAMEMEAEE